MLCDSYCSHGGRCTLKPGHDGDHDSDYCTWNDSEALTKEQADKVLIENNSDNIFVSLIAKLT